MRDADVSRNRRERTVGQILQYFHCRDTDAPPDCDAVVKKYKSRHAHDVPVLSGIRRIIKIKCINRNGRFFRKAPYNSRGRMAGWTGGGIKLHQGSSGRSDAFKAHAVKLNYLHIETPFGDTFIVPPYRKNM